MKTLTTEELVPYLPYKLEIMDLYDDKKSILCGIGKTKRNHKVEVYIEGCIVVTRFLSEIKPILRLLSDLTDDIIKEIYNDNEIDIVRMKYAITINYQLCGEWFKDVINLRQILNIENSHLTLPTWLYLELIKRHFDLYFSIESGLAIDIKTLKQ